MGEPVQVEQQLMAGQPVIEPNDLFFQLGEMAALNFALNKKITMLNNRVKELENELAGLKQKKK